MKTRKIIDTETALVVGDQGLSEMNERYPTGGLRAA